MSVTTALAGAASPSTKPVLVSGIRAYEWGRDRVFAVGKSFAEGVSYQLIAVVDYCHEGNSKNADEELPRTEDEAISGPSSAKEWGQSVLSGLEMAGEAFSRGIIRGVFSALPGFLHSRGKGGGDKALGGMPGAAVLSGVLEVISQKLWAMSGEKGEDSGLDPFVQGEISRIDRMMKENDEVIRRMGKDKNPREELDLRRLWQTTHLLKGLGRFVFHLGNGGWNMVGAARAHQRDGLVDTVLWLGSAAFSVHELRKSDSFRYPYTLHGYTPERLALTCLKLTLVTSLIYLQWSQTNIFVSSKPIEELDGIKIKEEYIEYDRILERLALSVLLSIGVTWGVLKLLEDAYTKRLINRSLAFVAQKEALAEANERLKKRKEDLIAGKTDSRNPGTKAVTPPAVGPAVPVEDVAGTGLKPGDFRDPLASGGGDACASTIRSRKHAATTPD